MTLYNKTNWEEYKVGILDKLIGVVFRRRKPEVQGEGREAKLPIFVNLITYL